VTLHSAARLHHDAVTGYSKIVLLLGDGQRRLLGCVAHLVGTHVTLSHATTLGIGIPLSEGGRVAGASIASLSSQHIAVSYSTLEHQGGKASTQVRLLAVHPKTDDITVQDSSQIIEAASSDTCVLATTERLFVFSVSDTTPALGAAWMATLHMRHLSEDIDSEIFGTVSILSRPPPSSVNWQVGDIQPGTMGCQPFNETGMLAAVVTFRAQRPSEDCGAYPAPAHAQVQPAGTIRRGQLANVSCNLGYTSGQLLGAAVVAGLGRSLLPVS